MIKFDNRKVFLYHSKSSPDGTNKVADETVDPMISLDLTPDTEVYNFYDFRDEDVPPFILLMSKKSSEDKNYVHFTTITQSFQDATVFSHENLKDWAMVLSENSPNYSFTMRQIGSMMILSAVDIFPHHKKSEDIAGYAPQIKFLHASHKNDFRNPVSSKIKFDLEYLNANKVEILGYEAAYDDSFFGFIGLLIEEKETGYSYFALKQVIYNFETFRSTLDFRVSKNLKNHQRKIPKGEVKNYRRPTFCILNDEIVIDYMNTIKSYHKNSKFNTIIKH